MERWEVWILEKVLWGMWEVVEEMEGGLREEMGEGGLDGGRME